MWHKNSRGPSTVPCGTPESTVALAAMLVVSNRQPNFLVVQCTIVDSAYALAAMFALINRQPSFLVVV